MKISYRWLSRHVDLSGVDAASLVNELTLSTAEVETLEPFLPHLAGITVGHVVEREKHPDADKLSLCRVDLGQGDPLQIVCGAPNVRAGLRVAVATVGTTLPGDLKIKRSKIRGVESNGMICSERELGLGDEHDGIWELDGDAPIGTPVASALGLQDWVFEIDNKSITHRPDLWGHRGIAAEVAALLRRPLKPLELELPPLGGDARFPVRIETDKCSRYLAVEIDGARATRSPFWLRSLLLAVGQRPLDLLVDLSNFVMLDLGQPNHLFDRHRLGSQGIVVRLARDGETLTTLDGSERHLVASDMLICDGAQPVALAGIMGGEGSKVADDTSALLLEFASFHAATVRRTSARLGLRSDASARFEKSLDPNLPPLAAAHFLALLRAEQPEVRVCAPITDVGDWKDPSCTIKLRATRVRKLLGVEIDDVAIANILTRLGFGVTGRGDVLDVRVPSNRATKDIGIEQDLVEEVGRIHRYGNVPEQVLEGPLVPPARDAGWARRMLVRTLEDRLAGAAHFHQTISYSFLPDDLMARLGIGEQAHVTVSNAINAGASRVRRSVVPSVVALLESNRRRRAEVRLFEVGKGYVPSASGEPHEVHEVAIALCRAPRKARRFDDNSQAQLQGVLDDLLAALGLEPWAWSRLAAAAASAWAHPGRCLVARFASDAAVACELAPLEPALARALGLLGELESDSAVARLDIDALLHAPRRAKPYAPIPELPDMLVDVAVALPADVPAGDSRAAILKAGKGLVARTELFDVYTGESVGAGRKSLAWHVTLRAGDRTLSDQDVKKFLERLEREAVQLGGQLRRE